MASGATSVAGGDPLSELVSLASKRKNPACDYVGELLPVEAFEYLARVGGLLVDVRTVPEWQMVGAPALDGCKGKAVFISWKIYPDMRENPDFSHALAQTGADKNVPIFFMCRGGGRSASAAQAMTQAGYTCCFNVATGFEGEADAQGHRGRVNGWQGSNLPWKH